MRLVSVAVACVLASVAANAARPWSMQVGWGDTIPGGTVYTVTLDSAGALRAERKGMPFTADGLTVTEYAGTLSPESVAAIRAAGERCIRQLDFDGVQGGMAGDGGFARVDISDGSATIGARLGRLRSRDESGKRCTDMLSMVRRSLAAGFVH